MWTPPEKIYRWFPVVDDVCQVHGVSQSLALAIITVESSGDDKAYRVEPGYYSLYIEKNKKWRDLMTQNNWKWDDVACSYGLMQLMFPTAWMVGYRGSPTGLYKPRANIDCGIKYIAQLIDKYFGCKHAALAHYNGGSTGAKQYYNGVDARPTRYARKAMDYYDRYRNYHLNNRR